MNIEASEIPPWWLLVVTGLVAGACSGTDQGSSCGRFVDGPVHLLTWNEENPPEESNPTAPATDDPTMVVGPQFAERKALDQLKRAHAQCNPESHVEVDPGDNRDKTLGKLRDGTPADVAIVNADQEIKRLCEDGLIHKLNGFERPPEYYARHIRKQITLDADGESLLPAANGASSSTLCAIPIAQHQLNRLFVNRDTLPAPLNPDNWTSLKEFLRDLEQLPPMPLFTVAGGDQWTLSLTAFENVMVAAVGYEDYYEFWTGLSLREAAYLGSNSKTDQYDTEPDLRPLEKTMAQLARLRPYMDVRSVSNDKQAWQDFVDGHGSFYVMGNWRDPDAEAHPHIERRNFPGTDEYYVFTVDAMVIPINAKDPHNGMGFLRMVTDPSVNEQYNEIKGSDSVLAIADQAIATHGRQFVEGLPLLLTEGDFKELQGRLTEWFRTGDTERFLEYVRDEYCRAGEREECPIHHEPKGVH